jgi:aliphatic sulfonates family ABC transporter substrate-binding protein
MTKRTRAGTSLFIALTLFTGAAVVPAPSSAQPTDPLPIRIGFQAVASWLLFGARSLGMYEKAGLTPTFLKFTAGAPMIAAAQGRSVDTTMVGTVPFLAGISQGVDWVMIGIDNEYPRAVGVVVRNDSGIKTLADLRGKTIAFFRGSTSHYAMLTILKRQGIPLTEVKLLYLEPAQQLAAMLNKNIDAAAVWEPWMQKLIHQANGRILVREADLGLYTGMGGYAVRRDWLAANREAARRYLEALLQAYDALEKDPSPALKAVGQEMGLPDEWTRAIFDVAGLPAIYRQTDPTYAYSLARGTAFEKNMKDLAQFLYEEKIIPKAVDVTEHIDGSVMAEVLKAHRKAR